MSEWWTYTISDFLLFSPRTWHRLFALYNASFWPAHLVPLVGGVAIFVALLRGREGRGRLIAGFLAACWLWVGGVFHLERYATINWAATYFGAAFVAQALLLAWSGLARGGPRLAAKDGLGFPIGAGMVLVALAYPAIGWAAGRPLAQAETFGMAPDPTALGTLGLVVNLAGRVRWLLVAIPLLWCLVNGAMLWAMQAPEAWALLAAPAAIIAIGFGAVIRSRTSS